LSHTHTVTLTRDAGSRLASRWSSAKGTTYYTNDAVGNLTQINYPASPDVTLAYDPLNRVTNMVDAAGTTKYTYTVGGKFYTEDGPFTSDTVTNTWDNRLRVGMDLQQPTGVWTNQFGYDAAKRLTNVTSPAGAFGYTFVGQASRLTQKLSLPNTSYITNSYDGNARLLSTTLKNSSGTILNSHSYSYNPANQRTQQVFNAGSTVNYTYDPIGQLKVADSATAIEDRGYAYDTAWNLNRRTNNLAVTTFTVNNLNEVTKVGTKKYHYDGNGNRVDIREDLPWYGYDDENRLIVVEDDGSGWRTEFTYDGTGRLRERREYTGASLTSTTRYVYDGWRVIQERDGNDTPTVSYTRGTDLSGSLEGAGGIGGLLARSHGYSSGNWSTHNFYHADGNGNVAYLVNSSQSLAAKYRYDPYGNTISSSGSLAAANTYRFSSKEIHVNSGLYDYGYRWYDPNTQTWLNRDPIGELGGLNLYGYVGNAPIDWMDPFGLEKGAELLLKLHNGYGGLNSFFGKIWNAPNTAMGLAVGGLGIPFGAKPSFGNNALQFTNHPFMFGGDITIGNTICYNKFAGPNVEMDDQAPYLYGDHERQHTYQGEQLGPLYLPANFFGGISSLLTTGSWHGNNFMERGPLSVPPTPWPNGRMR